jgi:hypothetical protein
MWEVDNNICNEFLHNDRNIEMDCLVPFELSATTDELHAVLVYGPNLQCYSILLYSMLPYGICTAVYRLDTPFSLVMVFGVVLVKVVIK